MLTISILYPKLIITDYMTLIAESTIFFGSIIVLALSSYVVVRSSIRIARITRLGELTIGFIVLSIATTLPEMIVSTTAIVSGDIGISIGNILGSNIANICLIIGLVGLIRPVRMAEQTLMKLTLMLFLCSVIIIIFLISSSLGNITGIALLLLFLVFSLYSLKKKINLGEIRLEEELVKLLKFKFTFGLKKTLFLFIAGLILTIISSKFVVDSASSIASILGIAGSVIGATIIAVGTSLPELSTSLNAVRENHLRLGLGNTIGSCLTNLTLVLGLILLVSPSPVDMNRYTTLLAFVLISTILLWIFLGGYGRKKLERKEGLVLLIVFIVFLIMIYYFPLPGLGFS